MLENESRAEIMRKLWQGQVFEENVIKLESIMMRLLSTKEYLSTYKMTIEIRNDDMGTMKSTIEYYTLLQGELEAKMLDIKYRVSEEMNKIIDKTIERAH